MGQPITKTTLVNASSAATGSVSVEASDGYNIHRFFTHMTAAASVTIQTSQDGTNFCDMHSPAITSTGDVTVIERPWSHIKVIWSGNTGDLTIKLDQLQSSLAGQI